MRYYSENYDLEIKIKDHKDRDITIEEIVDQYYKNPEQYFNTEYVYDEKNKQAAAAKDFSSSAIVANISNTSSIQNNIIYEKSIICSKVATYSTVRQDLSSFFLQSTPSQEQNNFAKRGLDFSSMEPGNLGNRYSDIFGIEGIYKVLIRTNATLLIVNPTQRDKGLRIPPPYDDRNKNIRTSDNSGWTESEVSDSI